MPTWDSQQYLKFSAERTQPAVDLAARIALDAPRRVIDLGCGPGNSTAVLARRWPGVELTGLDSSPAMIATAQADFPEFAWHTGDIAAWSAPANAPFDVVFSNAALQWVPDHARLLPHLFAQVAPGGACAFQVPANFDAPPHRLMRELAASPAWRAHFDPPPREWHAHSPEFYYDLLSPVAARLDLWTTTYIHVLEDVDAIIAWYRGTGLRPWLDRLPDGAMRARFLAEYRAALAPHFPPRPDGRVLFPFHRLFAIAYR
ncbi:MAG TPA: methyltransferase domain-containing protein [Opitutus sp.]|nr:methyltransferase domain-containing protein [Opitutus sp.]